MTSIPTIDLENIHSPTGMYAIAEQLRKVYSNVGFGCVINHGISADLIEQVFSISKKFHDLPLENKITIRCSYNNFRGFFPAKSYSLKQTGIGESTTTPNLSDSFGAMIELNDEQLTRAENTYFSGCNLWPSQLPQMKPVVIEYMNEMTKLSCRLLQAFAVCLNLDKHAFDYLIQPQPLYNLRMLHYYQQDPSNMEQLYGLAPHSDYGLLTLVAQDSTGGLQVREADGNKWIDVKPIPHALILNSADMLTRLSNGILRSTPHRVISPVHNERYSQVFFLQPDLDEIITPNPNCITQSGRPVQYENITYRKYIGNIFAQNYQAYDDTNRS